MDRSRRRSPGPWIWGRGVDLAVFGGSAAVGLGLAALAPLISPTGAVPGWAWLALVLGVDVAHVHATLFRTYLDRDELAKRPALYTLVPIACFAVGVALHSRSELTFWRALAYLAVFHFIRQQVGWVAIYRARAGERDGVGKALDVATVYASTIAPLVFWHANLPRPFNWFIEGDFVSVDALRPWVPVLFTIEAALLLAYVARAIAGAARSLPQSWGKHLVVGSTAVTWYVGIVATRSDLAFTACNVVVHGAPYIALLWAYSRARAVERPSSLVARVVALGVFAFFAALLVLAFAEELAWDRLVWHEAPPWFGGVQRDEPLLSHAARALVVPLLALPQSTHYALDALLWRRKDTGAAQARALGFA